LAVSFRPAIFDRDVATLDIAGFLEALLDRFDKARVGTRQYAGEDSDHRHRRLLRACRKRPCSRCSAECSQQFSPSNGDCHTPLPREVRKWKDTTPRACSLAVQGGQVAGRFALSLWLPLHYSRRQLLADAAIAASRAGS